MINPNGMTLDEAFASEEETEKPGIPKEGLSLNEAFGEEPEKEEGHFSRLVTNAKADPAQAALAAASAGAESYVGLKGGQLLSHALAPTIDKASEKLLGKGALGTGVGIAGKMAAFALGNYGTGKAVKAGEELAGIAEPIAQAQQANPELSEDAGLAVMAPMAVKSVQNYAKMGLPKALQTGAFSAAGGAAFEPIRYGVETAASKAMGSNDPVAPVTTEGVLHSAAMMAGLGAENAKVEPKVKPVIAEKPTIPVTDDEAPADVPLSEEESLAMQDAMAGKKASIDATNKAVESTEEAGLTETATALKETANEIAEQPITDPVEEPIEEEDAVGEIEQTRTVDRRAKTPSPVPEDEIDPSTPEGRVILHMASAVKNPKNFAFHQAGALRELQEAQAAKEAQVSSTTQEPPLEAEALVAEKPKKGKKVKAIKPEEPVYDSLGMYRDNPDGTSEEYDLTTNEWVPVAKRQPVAETTTEPPVVETPVIEPIAEPPVEELPLDSSAEELPQQGASAATEIPVASPIEEAPKGKVTPAAQKYADTEGVDTSKVAPNKYGNITTKEIKAHLKSLPVEETPAIEEPVLPEEVGIEAPEIEEPEIPEEAELEAPETAAPTNANLNRIGEFLGFDSLSDILSERGASPEDLASLEQQVASNPKQADQILGDYLRVLIGEGEEVVVPEPPVEELPVDLPIEEVAPEPPVKETPVAELQDDRVISELDATPYTPAFSGLNVSYPKGNLGVGLASSASKKALPISKAVQGLKEYDHGQTKDFVGRVHDAKSGVLPPRIQASQSDAISTTKGKGKVSVLSKYKGNIDYDELKALETLKAAKAGQDAVIFKQKSGGTSALYEIETSSQDVESLTKQFNGAGIENVTFELDSQTGTIRAFVLAQGEGTTPEQLAKQEDGVKKIAYENKYGIKIYKGTSEVISGETSNQTQTLQESLGRLRGAGDARGTGGANSLRMANSLWELAREAGIDLGERPTAYQDPIEKAGSVSGYEIPLERQKEADAKIPVEKEDAYKERLTRASDFLDREFGNPRLELIEGKDENEGLILAVDPEGRVKWKERGEGMGNFSSQKKLYDAMKNAVMGRMRLLLADSVNGTWSVRSTKINEAKRKVALNRIEELRAIPKLTTEQKTELKGLKESLDGRLMFQRNPWKLGRKQFEDYVRGVLRNSFKSIRRVQEKREQIGLGEQSEGSEGIEGAEDMRDDVAIEDSDNSILESERRQAFNQIRDKSIPVEDRLALAKYLIEAKTLSKEEWSLLTPDLEEIGKAAGLPPRALGIFQSEAFKAGEIRDLRDSLNASYNKKSLRRQQKEEYEPSQTVKTAARIVQTFPLEELLKGQHRGKDGKILFRPGAETPTERTAPPQVMGTHDAKSWLQALLNTNSFGKGDAGQVKELLSNANLKNIPVDVFDYLEEGSYGYYDRETGRIALNGEKLGIARVDSETSLHEVHHALLSFFLDPKNSDSLTPRQKKLVGDINRLYEQTRDLAIKEGLFTQEDLDRVNSGDLQSLTESEGVAYAFSNVDEWTSATMANKDVREYLRGLRSRDLVKGTLKSIWQTFKDLVASLFGMQKSVHRQAFDRIMELATDKDAGRYEGEQMDSRLNRPDLGERYTEKVSEAQPNENLDDKDKVSFMSQKRDQATAGASKWIENGGSFEELMNRNVSLTVPEIIAASAIFRTRATQTKVELETKSRRGEALSATEIRSKNEAIKREKQSNQLLAQIASEGGQILGHSQDLSRNSGAYNVEQYIKMLIGSTPEELTEGKLNLRGLNEGLAEIKTEIAKVTVDAVSPYLEEAGITGEEDISSLRDILSDPSTSYRNVKDAVASLMPGANLAKATALAERIFRMYSAVGNQIGKDRLPKLVVDTYNGEAITPRGDQFLSKLGEFLKIGQYQEDEINKVLLESLGLTGYDVDFIKGIRKDIDAMTAMPEGDMRYAAGTAIVNKAKKKFFNGVLKDWKNGANGKHLMDLVTSAWQAGVLSGPPTAGVNLFGSAASITVESMMEATGYAVKTRDMRYFGDVFGGFLSAIAGGKSTGKPSAAMNEILSSLKGEGTKYRNAILQENPHLENIDTEGLQGAIKHLANYGDKLKWVGRVMTAMDAINMTAADEAKQRMATRFFLSEAKGHEQNEVSQMMQDLFNPTEEVIGNYRQTAESEVNKFMADKSDSEKKRWVDRRTLELVANNREEKLPGVTAKGKEAAEQFTYNNTAKGFLGKVLVGLTSQINQNVKAGKFVFSFMNTLANIMNQTLDYTPYGYLRAENKTHSQQTIERGDKFAPRTFEVGSPEQYAERARATFGTAAIMAIAYMAYQGFQDEQEGKEPFFSIHGAGPRDPYERQQLTATRNWQANSVKIGGVWYRYVDFPILGSLLGGLGTASDAFRYKKDEQTIPEVFGQATLSALTTILDKNLLQGANNFFQVIRGSSPGQQINSLERLVGGTVSGFTNPGLVRWLRNTTTGDKNGMVNQLDQSTFAGWIASMVPASIGYNTPALNTLGEPIQRPWYTATTWRFSDLSNQPPHPIFTPLINAGLMVPSPSKSTSFSVLKPDGTILDAKMGRYPKIYRRFVELRGQAMKDVLTPDVIQSYTQAAKVNLTEAQAMLNNDLGDEARRGAVSQIESELLEGTLKLE